MSWKGRPWLCAEVFGEYEGIVHEIHRHSSTRGGWNMVWLETWTFKKRGISYEDWFEAPLDVEDLSSAFFHSEIPRV